jgi:tripartite-type tricarboxylate transporter receptor subunit TctC
MSTRMKGAYGKGSFFGRVSAAFLLLFLWSPLAWSAEAPFPNKPITIVVNYAPGGVMDTHARILADRLGEVLGQPVLKVHKPGGGGTLGASFAARAKPDGYTLFTGTSSSLILTPIIKKVDYTWEDFVSIGIYCRGAVSLYVKKDAKWKTLQEFIQEGKERQFVVSSSGKLTHTDFVQAIFAKMAGIKQAHVPYKSCGEAVTALLGGHVDADYCQSSIGQLEGGAVRVLAVADYERSKINPEGKTFKEQGYPVALPLYYSLCVPAKTPKKVIEILGNGMQEVFKRHGKEIQEELIRMEFIPSFFDIQRSMKEFNNDYENSLKVVKESGLDIEK